jgi:hypothetical protein
MGNTKSLPTKENLTQYELDIYGTKDDPIFNYWNKQPKSQIFDTVRTNPDRPDTYSIDHTSLVNNEQDSNPIQFTYNSRSLPAPVSTNVSNLGYGNLDKDYIVKSHNNIRALNGGGKPIRWSNAAESRARTIAKRLAKDCSDKPNNRKQNVYVSEGKMDPSIAIRKWFEQCGNYNSRKPNPPNFDHVRNFTSMVWRNNKGVGCAQEECKNGGSVLVCDYDKTNSKRQFKRNVERENCQPRFVFK